MARLNDPPVPPVESIDALKRRFIRQNREIARVNSTQSQRIRNLETEISRLLAENIALRESAIAAAVEAERFRAASRLGRDVVELKSRLESKLTEVNALVAELGGLPEKVVRRSSNVVRRRKSVSGQDPAASPNERDWRSRQTLGGAFADGQDGRLPAIMEDKYYPRRTLENEELRVLTAITNAAKDDTESPDLGPPPVAHFEVADPIVFDSAKSPKRVSGGIVTGEDDVVSLSKNLESRRKRRTSSLMQDLSSLHNQTEEDSQDNNNELAVPLKPQPKRKFDGSEMDVEASQISQNDGFEYARREANVRNRPRPTRFMPRPADRAQPIEQPLSPQKSLARTILAPKSTNSPTKKVTLSASEKMTVPRDTEISPVKPRTSRTTASNNARVTRINPSEVDDGVQEPAYVPKTPVPVLEDIISPPSSAVDTVPKTISTEAAITNSVEDVLNGSIGRGSRRARAAVSYAEPNLRDKMRRPDKKLVGAVEGISKVGNTLDKECGRETSRDKSSDPGQSVQSRNEINGIKSEGNDDEAWKGLPSADDEKEEVASPLQNKEKHTISKISEPRKKRTFSESEGTRSKNTNTGDDLDKAVSRLSIYDAPTSSPISTSTDSSSTIAARRSTTTTSQSSTTTAVPTRSRRHSTLAASDSSIPSGPNHSSSSAPTTTNTSSKPSSSLSSRSAATLGKENLNLTSTSAAASKLKRATSVQSLSVNTSQTTLQNQNHNHGRSSTATAEKTLVGSRRRSMMV